MAKIKVFVTPSSPVPACVSELFKFDAGKHHEASHNCVLNAVRSRYTHGVDSQLVQVQQIATPYAANIIISEMKESCKMTTVTCIPYEHNDNSVEVKVGEHTYTVEVGGAVSCSCSAFSASSLLCRHIIFTIHHLQKNLTLHGSPDNGHKRVTRCVLQQYSMLM